MINKAVQIQAQDSSGNWRTYSQLINDEPQRMLQAMQEVQRQYPNYRVRAINMSGQLLNIL